MPLWRKVSFLTTSSREEIEQALSRMGYISHISIQRHKGEKRKLTDLQQLLIIYGLAALVGVGVFLYIVMNTGGM